MTASTQLRALEGEIAELENAPSSIRQFRKSKLCDKAITIAKELEVLAFTPDTDGDQSEKSWREESDEWFKYARKVTEEKEVLEAENATLKRRLDEAMKERGNLQSIRTANDRLRSFLTEINILAQSRNDTELCKSTYEALEQP